MMMHSTSTALHLNNNNTPCTTPKTMAATDGTSATQFPQFPDCPPPPCRRRASAQEDEMDHENLHQQQRLRMPYFPHLSPLPSSFAATPASTKATAVMVTPEKHQQQRKRSYFELHQLYSFATINSGSSITNDMNIRTPQLEPRTSAHEDDASLSSPPSSPSWTMAFHNQPLILENLKEWRSFSSMKPRTSAFTAYTPATASTSTANAASNSTATASMGIPSSKTFDDDDEDDECNGNSGRIIKQETKRRRRASLLDEFNSRCRLSSNGNTRPRFPRAA